MRRTLRILLLFYTILTILRTYVRTRTCNIIIYSMKGPCKNRTITFYDSKKETSLIFGTIWFRVLRELCNSYTGCWIHSRPCKYNNILGDRIVTFPYQKHYLHRIFDENVFVLFSHGSLHRVIVTTLWIMNTLYPMRIRI